MLALHQQTYTHKKLKGGSFDPSAICGVIKHTTDCLAVIVNV